MDTVSERSAQPEMDEEEYCTDVPSSKNPDVALAKPKKVVKPVKLAFAIFTFFALLKMDLIEDNKEASKALALLVSITVLWSTGAVPLYITSMFLPIPVVLTKMLRDPVTGEVLSCPKASTLISEQFFNPTVLLFLGGFTIAQGLHKFGLSERLALYILEKAGTDPKRIMISIMGLSWFLSSFISNVASVVVVISIMIPLIQDDIPASDINLKKQLLLAIAFTNAISGMNTLIASPQNAIAMTVISDISDHTENVSFVEWMIPSVPTSLIITLFIYKILRVMFPAKSTKIRPQIKKMGKMTKKHYVVLVTTVVTILLMCANGYISEYVGSIGITALIPVVVFFGTGILNQDDFGRLNWPVLMLMGGGLALGFTLENSDLLYIISNKLAEWTKDQSVWVVTSVFISLIGLLGTSISSTVAAVIVLPVIGEVGKKYNHLVLMVLLGAITTSGSLSLPISSFPNSVSFAVRDRDNSQLLSVKDFAKPGVLITTFSVIMILSVGYFLGLFVGM